MPSQSLAFILEVGFLHPVTVGSERLCTCGRCVLIQNRNRIQLPQGRQPTICTYGLCNRGVTHCCRCCCIIPLFLQFPLLERTDTGHTRIRNAIHCSTFQKAVQNALLLPRSDISAPKNFTGGTLFTTLEELSIPTIVFVHLLLLK